MNMTSMMTVIDNNSDNNHNETMTPFVHPSPNEKNESPTATTQTPFVDEIEEEESSMTATPSTSEDWSEDYPSDEDDVNNNNDNDSDKKVNGTGLILYVTPTNTKAAYWKRRLGWKPNMSKLTTKKIKKIFRAPVRTHIRKGSYDLKGADALAIKPKGNKSFIGSEKDRKRVVSDEELVLEYGTKDFDKLGAVDHELVFA